MKQIPSRRAHGHRSSALLALVAAIVVAVTTLAPASAYDQVHTRFQGDISPMGQTNGPVWAVKVAGGKIFVGGDFTSTRPSGAAAGVGETRQGYLAAFNATTGAPIAGFAPKLTNTYGTKIPTVRAMALSPDERILYVGGDFNQVNGERAEHVAKFDVATGKFLGMAGVNGVNGPVHALAVSNDNATVYVGGAFSQANYGKARNNVVGFNTVTGALRPWYPKISAAVSGEALRVTALAVSSDDLRVFLGGPFKKVNGVVRQGFAGTTVAKGANAPGFRADYLTMGWGTALVVHRGRVLLGARDDLDPTKARREGVISIDEKSGAKMWDSSCYGDTFALAPLNNEIYVGSHTHDCIRSGLPETTPRIYNAMHALNASTGIMRNYWVVSNGTTADNDSLLMSRAVATDGNVLVMGGGFNSVNGHQQANLARFVVGSAAPTRAAWPDGKSCSGCDYVDLTILKGADTDDSQLTYRVYRDWTTTNPIYTVTSTSYPYRYTQTLAFRDTGVTPGQQVYYRVSVTDPAGNTVWSVRTPTYTVGSTTVTNARLAESTTTDSSARTAPSSQPSTDATTDQQKQAEASARKAGLL